MQLTSDAVAPSPTENPFPRKPIRLWLLLLAHLLLGPSFSILSMVEGKLPIALEYLLVVPVLGAVLAQSTLLGFWAAFFPTRWWVRLIGLVTALPYLQLLLDIGASEEEFDGLATIATVGITAVLGLIRWRYANLCRLAQRSVQAREVGVKFSIRGLLLFTFIIAVTTVGVSELRESGYRGRGLLTISVLSWFSGVVGLAAIWAGLEFARPALRSLVVVLIAAISGVLFVYAIRAFEWETIFYFVSLMVIQAGVLIASLLVVRSCGYRLVRKPKPEAEPLD